MYGGRRAATSSNALRLTRPEPPQLIHRYWQLLAAPFIRACWLSWLAVETVDRAEVVKALGLTDIREITWVDGLELIDEVAHDEEEPFSAVVVAPSLQGWPLVVGRYFGLPHPQQTAQVTELCRELSARFGKAAQLFFHRVVGQGARSFRAGVNARSRVAGQGKPNRRQGDSASRE